MRGTRIRLWQGEETSGPLVRITGRVKTELAVPPPHPPAVALGGFGAAVCVCVCVCGEQFEPV